MSRKRALLFAAAGALLVLTGCSATGAGQPGASATADPEVAAKVPQSIKSRGTLRVMTDPTYPPLESVDASGTMVGSDVDLMNAIGDEMGLKVVWSKGSFDGIIPGLVANRFDASIAGMYISTDKYATVSLVEYGKAFNQVLVKPDYTGPKIASNADMCGLTVAIQTGSTGIDEITSASGKCGDSGKKPINLLQFQNANDVLLSVASGRAQGAIVGNVSSSYQIDQAKVNLKVGGTLPTTYLNGIAIQKDAADGLGQAMSLALQKLNSSGEYKKILAKWKIADFAVNEFQVNPANPETGQ